MTHIEQLIQDLCPNGVEFKTLGEVCIVKTAPMKLDKKEYYEQGLYPIVDQGQKFIVGYTDNEKALIPADDYVIFGDHTREIKYVNFAFAQGADGVKILKTKNEILPRFLYHVLKNTQIPSRGYNRHWTIAKDIEIPIPPLEIQERIVAILDRFSALAAELQAELQMRRKQYEYYRTQLLTPHSDGNSADNTDDCNWEWKTFAELGVFYGGLSGKSKEDFKDGNAKFITYLNIGCNPALRLDISETVKIGPNEKQNIVQYGDALFTGSSETPDECAMSSVVTEQPAENLYLNSFCFGFRFNSLDGICPAFYKHYFRSDAFRKAVRRTANGTTRFNVYKKEFAKLSIPIPPLAEQERIVAILDKFEKLITSMEEGIPAEQIRQQKRYEYYRDLLLTFDRKAE